MVLANGAGTPLGVLVEATPAEVTLLQRTVPPMPWELLDAKPERLILDRAYDSNQVRNDPAACGIEPIVSARKNKAATHQDGRQLRCYKSDGRSSARMLGCKLSVAGGSLGAARGELPRLCLFGLCSHHLTKV